MKNYIVKEVTHYCNLKSVKCQAMKSRAIDYYDLTFVTSGSMVYYANGVRYVLNKNDAVFLPPGTVRSREDGDKPCGYVSFNFYALPDAHLPFEYHLKDCMSSEIKRLVSAFPQSHLHNYFHSEEKLANMLNYILFELFDNVSMQSHNDHVGKMIKYIHSSLTEKISLSDVSESVGLTKEYAASVFKREMRKTVMEYINERKMLCAKELIQTGELSLTEVATQLGFENYNYFSRLFKKHFDMTPIAFKNR